MSLPYKYQTLAIEKVFRDPVHNYVHVQHQVILDLINSKEVQRLRRIKQLGTASFTFHGAEHSRFPIPWGFMKSVVAFAIFSNAIIPLKKSGQTAGMTKSV